MILNKSTDSITVALSGAVTTSELSCVSSWKNVVDGYEILDRGSASTNGITDVVLISGYSVDGVPVMVLSITIFNSDTVDAEVSIKFKSSLGEDVLYKKTIASGESIQYTPESGFFFNPAPSVAGDATAANQVIGNASLSSIDTRTGSLTESAPLTDTASSGLNGRLQRIAQRITSLIGLIPVSLGQKTMAGSMAVVFPSDQSSIPVTSTLNAETTKVIGTVNPPAITKGTQGSTGFTTQDLKDSGRTPVRYYAVAAAAGTTTTETAITLTRASGTSATSTGVSHTPTSGKTFRIQSISFATRGHNTATAQTTTFNFRINTAGAVITSSTPVILAMRSATPATANSWDRVFIQIPDGLEIYGDGTLQFGITAAATYTTNAPTWDVTIIGYEY